MVRVREPGYYTWKSIKERAGNANGKNPWYADTELHEDWQDFRGFRDWYLTNRFEDWQVDKDLKVLGNKVYGPETCVFVPTSLNGAFTLRGKGRGELPLGVTYQNTTGKYLYRANHRGQSFHLGYGDSPDEGHRLWLLFKEDSLRAHALDYSYYINHDPVVLDNILILAEGCGRFAREGKQMHRWTDLLEK